MITPEFPFNEHKRLAAVRDYKLLDTAPEETFDNLTELVAEICEVPIALVTLLDTNRNFLKSHYGVPFSESPRSISFCGHAILEETDLVIIEDARNDERFKDNPLLTNHNAIFYAGAKLVNPEGFALGTLCVFDHKPRVLTNLQKKTLLSLAKQIVILFEERRNNEHLQHLQNELEVRNRELQSFAGVVSHDMKQPLSNIITTSDLLQEKYKYLMDMEGLEYLSYLKKSCFSLSNYISGMLALYRTDETLAEKQTRFDLKEVLEEIIELYDDPDTEFTYPKQKTPIVINKAALQQILLNLIGNSIKYNDKEIKKVTIDFVERDIFYLFGVSDNGMGIPPEKIDTIFDLFTTADVADKNGDKGLGIGLSTVKKLIQRLDGEIEVSSELGEGTHFIFKIKKH